MILISENNSIIPLLSYAIFFIHIRSWVTAQQSIFQNKVQIASSINVWGSLQCIYNARKKETKKQY